jgi:biotin carboxylase
MKDKIVIIGANDFQNQLILKAKSKGLETHVFAWKSGDVGEKSADFFYPISIIEKDVILEKCKEINPIGIISIGSDLASITVNYVAEKMNLVGNSLRSSFLSTNKHEMRLAFERLGIPSPKSELISDKFESDTFNMKFPVIVKPTDRSGSRGIYKVNNIKELEYGISRARKESFEKKVLVEEFVGGEEYSVETISYKGKHRMLAITKKFTTGAPKFIETGHLEPAVITAELESKIVSIIEGALDALEITYGASHSEIKIDSENNVKVIEVGGRMGGDCIGSDLVDISTGYDYVEMVIDVACRKEIILVRKHAKRSGFIKFILTEEDFENLDIVKEKYNNCIYRISKIDPIESNKIIEDSSTRYGYYIVAADTEDDIYNIVNIAYGRQ